MKKLLSVMAASLVCVAASAQTAGFEGASGALNLNSVSVNTKLSGGGNSLDGLGQQSWNGALQASYGFVTSPTSVFTIGATYGLGSNRAGEASTASGTAALRVKEQFSLYVEPGFLINDKTIAYGKVAYEHAKATASVTGQSDETKSLKGSSFGLGVRTMIDKKSFIQAELKQINYDSIDAANNYSFKPKATVATIGFGLKF